jgi:hypothetical protein
MGIEGMGDEAAQKRFQTMKFQDEKRSSSAGTELPHKSGKCQIFQRAERQWRAVAAAIRSHSKHGDCGQKAGMRQIRNNALLIQ